MNVMQLIALSTVAHKFLIFGAHGLSSTVVSLSSEILAGCCASLEGVRELMPERCRGFVGEGELHWKRVG